MFIINFTEKNIWTEFKMKLKQSFEIQSIWMLLKLESLTGAVKKEVNCKMEEGMTVGKGEHGKQTDERNCNTWIEITLPQIIHDSTYYKFIKLTKC